MLEFMVEHDYGEEGNPDEIDDIFIKCPHCGYCESHPIDEQVHHMQTFELIDWNDDHTKAQMRCVKCKEFFVADFTEVYRD